MIPIKHILNETGVKQVFRLGVPSGTYSGTYDIEKPIGWDDIESKVNIDGETFHVKDFIIGDNEKISFTQYSQKIAFDLIKNVYQEQGGDGIVQFKWLVVKNGVEYDLLGDQFDVNMNKYVLSPEKSMYKIEIEITKNEAHQKFFNRGETTIDLFAEKDIDENEIDPVQTFDIGYKKGDKVLENFYFATAGQERGNLTNESNKFYVFSKSEENQLEYSNPQSGVAAEDNGNKQAYFGPFLLTPITLTSVKLSLSTFDIGIYTDNVNFFSDVWIYITIKTNGVVENIQIPGTKAQDANFVWDSTNYKGGRISFNNVEFKLPSSLKPNSSIDIWFVSPSNTKFKTILLNESPSISISSNLESPIVKTRGIRLINAIDQAVKSYTASELSVQSNYIGPGGVYHNTSISTGLYLRGLPAIYNGNKIKTSLKKLLEDGSAKLMALGFDLVDDKVVIEDIHYFFKDLRAYDLSEKQYIWEGFKIENDKDVRFNTLLFGSKKYSTDKKDDIRNFNTVAEFCTPIKSTKNKFDKQTDLIIDEYKIQEMIEDNSSKTNDNDDDLVLIDMVNVSEYWDNGVFENCNHSSEGGNLVLSCLVTPFDTTLISVGTVIEVQEVLNVGTWTVLEVNGTKIKLNKTSGITEGNADTPIRYKIGTLTKNRTSDGFTEYQNIRNPDTATNIRHNPKFQMARWFSFFGSGLRKKGNDELLKVTSYKNNSTAEIKCNSEDLSNELSDLVKFGADETLSRLRSYDQTFFNGDAIEISFKEVTFEEFFNIYHNWKFGIDNNRLQSRGYLTLNTPEGILDVYPFGDGAFSHNRKTNVFSVKAKIKGKSVDNPTLLSVVQIDKKTVELEWDFNNEYINPLSKIQYSLDGFNWITLEDVLNLKTVTIDSDIFLNIISGTDVYFRVIVSTADYYNKVSNTIQIDWQFNDWTYKEIGRQENYNCGFSQLNLEFRGTVDLQLNLFFASYPGGGNALISDSDTLETITSFNSPYGADYTETQLVNISLLNETKKISLLVKNSDKTDTEIILNCNYGNSTYQVYSAVEVLINQVGSADIISNNIDAVTVKKYINMPSIE